MTTRKRPRQKPDAGLTGAVLDYLATQRDVWAERRNSGGQIVKNRDGSYRSIALGEPGTPDVTGYLRATSKWMPGVRLPALPFAIELKSKAGKLNANQKAWHAKAERFGIPVLVARSIGDVRAFLGRLRRGALPSSGEPSERCETGGDCGRVEGWERGART